MTVTDLTSMANPQLELSMKLTKLLNAIGDDAADYCYQCCKCTSGCEAMKLLELEPHHIMALAKSGFVQELIDSELIWYCVTCYKCKERCPQLLAPVDLLFALKNIAVSEGKQLPGEYANWLQSVLTTGWIQTEKKVTTRKYNRTETRSSLKLPPLPQLQSPSKYQEVVMKLATELLITD